MKKYDKELIAEAIGLKKTISAKEIEEMVDKHLDFTMHEIKSKNRKRELADARAGVCVLFWIAGLSQEKAESRVGLNSHGAIKNHLNRVYDDINYGTDYVIGSMRLIVFYHNRDNVGRCYPKKFDIVRKKL